jgi:hypothetical protein
MKVQPVALSNTHNESSLTKTAALVTFRALRSVAGYVAELPAVATQVADDVRQAWEESSRPNA